VAGIDAQAVEFGMDLIEIVKPDVILMNDRRSPNPAAIVAGRQVLYGKPEDLWRRGENVAAQALIYDQIVLTGRGAEVMERNGIDFLIEYKPQPFVLKNATQLQYFTIIAENPDWLLLKLLRGAVNGNG
jgi:hypothetical protein